MTITPRALWVVLLAAVAIGTSVVAGPTPAAVASSGQVTLSGTVTVDNSGALAGAGEVAVHYSGVGTSYAWYGSPYVLTDAAGNFSITGDSGSYTLFFQYKGSASIASMYWGGPTRSDETSIIATSNVTGLNITLPPRPVVSGQVSLGSPGNHPSVAIAYQVSVFSGSSYSWDGVYRTTAADGRFSLAIDPGDYTLTFSAPGYQTRTADGGTHVGTADVSGVNLTLPSTGSISGHVAVGTASQSASAGQVKVTYGTSDPSDSTQSVLTDSRGDFLISGLDSGEYNLGFDDVADHNFQSAQYFGVAVTDGALDATVPTRVLTTTGSISGRVFLGDGGHPAGAGDVQVYLNDGPNSEGQLVHTPTTTTDASGRYSISGLSAGTDKLYFHYAGTGDWADQYWNGAYSWDNATSISVGSAPVTADVTLVASGSLSGALLTPSGQVANEPQVTAYLTDSAGDRIGSVFVEGSSDGSFLFPRLAAGQYLLYFQDFSNDMQWYHQTSTEPTGETVTVSPGVETRLGQVKVIRTASLMGAVTCSGQCAPGGLSSTASLEARATQSSPWVYVSAQWTGAFYSFGGLLPGEYRVLFNGSADYGCQPAVSDPITITEGSNVSVPLTEHCGSGGLPAGSPIGGWESSVFGDAGTVQVTGWALDPDDVGAISVYPYVDGVPLNGFSADSPRTDIGTRYPNYGPNHGFSVTLPVPAGAHQLCLVAQNFPSDPSQNTSLGCRNIDDERFVMSLYRNYLGRAPSTDDLNYWTSRLASGAPRSSVSQGFVTSDEYRLIRIDAAYHSILGRGADPDGRLWWLNQMRSGAVSADGISLQFYASPEYVNSAQHWAADGDSTSEWVHQLYVDLLHRSPDASGIAYWAGAARRYGRQAVVNTYWNEPETAGERVSEMYASYLGRIPDPDGLAYWTSVDVGAGDTPTRETITSSQEYYNRAQTLTF